MAGILISLLIGLVILAVICFIVQNYLPLDPPLKQLVLLIVGVIFLIWLILLLTGTAPLVYVPRGRVP
jgi:hypothetical protein